MNKSSDIQKFILDNVENHPGDIAIVLAKKFGFSRQSPSMPNKRSRKWKYHQNGAHEVDTLLSC